MSDYFDHLLLKFSNTFILALLHNTVRNFDLHCYDVEQYEHQSVWHAAVQMTVTRGNRP